MAFYGLAHHGDSGAHPVFAGPSYLNYSAHAGKQPGQLARAVAQAAAGFFAAELVWDRHAHQADFSLSSSAAPYL